MYTHWSASGPCDSVQLLLSSLEAFFSRIKLAHSASLRYGCSISSLRANRAVTVLIPCQAKSKTVIGNVLRLFKASAMSIPFAS